MMLQLPGQLPSKAQSRRDFGDYHESKWSAFNQAFDFQKRFSAVDGFRDLLRLKERSRFPAHDAAKCGNVEKLRKVLRPTRFKKARVAYVDQLNEDGDTSLHLATRHGQAKVVKVLLRELGSDIRGRNAYTRDTALHMACRGNHLEVLRILLKAGAKIETKNKENQTSLHRAAAVGNLDAVKMLEQANPEAVQRALLVRDKKGRTPKAIAVQFQRDEVVSFLTELEGQTSRDGETPGAETPSSPGAETPSPPRSHREGEMPSSPGAETPSSPGSRREGEMPSSPGA